MLVFGTVELRFGQVLNPGDIFMSTAHFSDWETLAPRLPDAVELIFFRALQEALTNVHQHSGGSAAEVRIVRSDDRIELRVKDNGPGIQQESLNRFLQTGNGMGVGLSSLRERVRDLGGNLCFESDGSGTASYRFDS
jgi:signal transduction histidine kinase